MDEQIKIGTEDCSVQTVMKVLKESESFLLFYDKWQEFADELHIERITIKELDEKRTLHQTYKIQHVVRDLLELWVSKEGSRATLDQLLKALQAVKLVALRDRLNETFVLPNADKIQKVPASELKHQSNKNSQDDSITVSFVKKEESIEDFLCPVCLQIPEAPVYLCSGGHLYCSKCYSQTTKCSECQTPLDKDSPIRNIPIERMLNRVKIECSFKSNGCDEKLSRKDVQNHKNDCCYDFEKFGEFMSFCTSIGYSNCGFKFNNGNTKEAVEHFVSEHGCILTTSEKFQMVLTSFKESAMAGGSGFHVWTPIIANLKERKCYLLTVVVLNKKDASFTWLSIFLPYRTNEHRQISPVEIEYTVKTDGGLQFTVWTGKPMSLKKAKELLPNKIAFVNYSLPFVQDCSEEGSLLIDCNIKRHGVAVPEGREQMQSFVCTRNLFLVVENIELQSKVPVLFNRYGGSSAAISFRNKLEKGCKRNRNNFMSSMRSLFEGEIPARLTSEDVEWLKTELIFLIAQYGSVEGLKYLFGKGVNCNIVDEVERSPIHYTMYDSDKKIGLEKAKLLVDSVIANVHVLNNDVWSLLHYSAIKGNSEAVEYFLQKGCDVNATNLNGCTPLHYAVSHSSEEEGLKIAKSLLAKGADLSIKNNSGENALELATKKGKTKIAQLLRSLQSSK